MSECGISIVVEPKQEILFTLQTGGPGPAGPPGPSGETGVRRIVTADYTQDIDDGFIGVDSPVDVTITLIQAADDLPHNLILKQMGAGRITAVAFAGDLIDADPTAQTRFRHDSMTLVPTAGRWSIA